MPVRPFRAETMVALPQFTQRKHDKTRQPVLYSNRTSVEIVQRKGRKFRSKLLGGIQMLGVSASPKINLSKLETQIWMNAAHQTDLIPINKTKSLGFAPSQTSRRQAEPSDPNPRLKPEIVTTKRERLCIRLSCKKSSQVWRSGHLSPDPELGPFWQLCRKLQDFETFLVPGG